MDVSFGAFVEPAESLPTVVEPACVAATPPLACPFFLVRLLKMNCMRRKWPDVNPMGIRKLATIMPTGTMSYGAASILGEITVNEAVPSTERTSEHAMLRVSFPTATAVLFPFPTVFCNLKEPTR